MSDALNRAKLAVTMGEMTPTVRDALRDLIAEYEMQADQLRIARFDEAELYRLRQIPDEMVEAVREHRWHVPTGKCSCGEFFPIETAFLRHSLSAALQPPVHTNGVEYG